MRIEPFEVAIPDDVLADLGARVSNARLPNAIAGAGWEQGTDLEYLEELSAYWSERFDWREHEARLNALDQWTTEIDGQRIYFIHQRSGRSEAMPLLLAHGWPGSVLEFIDTIDPFVNPSADQLAFDLVVPALPGYGFSGPTSQAGWHPRRIAEAFIELMAGLGYERFGVQGGDWGSVVAANMADLAPEHVAGLHLNFLAGPRPDPDEVAALAPAHQAALATREHWQERETGYQAIQGTKPQTVGYALEDSPVGLAAWIVEKFRAWSDCDGDVERSFSKDQLLANITLYWVTKTATSSARLYHEMRRAGVGALPQAPVVVPTAVAHYPAEIARASRAWAEHRYHVTHWVDMPRGGHFAAMEVPDLFVSDVREFFTSTR